MPVEVTDLARSKPTNIWNKILIRGEDVYTRAAVERVLEQADTVTVFTPTTTRYLLCDVDDEGYCSLMDDDTGELVEDIQFTDREAELRAQARELLDGGAGVVASVVTCGELRRVVAVEAEE